MDVSPVSLVSPEPSAPAKPDAAASDSQQFDQLLAAGAAANASARNAQGTAPAPRQPFSPSRDSKSSARPPATQAPARTDTASDDAKAATTATADAGQDAATPTTTPGDEPSTGTSGQTKGTAAKPAGDDGSKSDGQAASDAATAAVPAPVVVTLIAAAQPDATGTPNEPAAASGKPAAPAPGSQGPQETPDLAAALGTPAAGTTAASAGTGTGDAAQAVAPSPAAAAQKAAAAAAQAASAPFTAVAAATSEAATTIAAAVKPAAPDGGGAAPVGGPGKTAAEVLAQLNADANASVKVTPAETGQDAGQSGLSNLTGGNDAPVTAGSTSTLSGDTLLASQLGETHHTEESQGSAPLPDGGLTTTGEANALVAHGAPAANAAPATAAPSAPPAARPAPPPLQPLIDQVLPTLSQAASSDGNNRFTIQLRPPELGKVQVDLKISQDGHVTASIMADRQDTLNLLQRDSHMLEQALSEAGLTANNGDLQFSLSGDSQGTGFDDHSGASYNAGIAAATATAAQEADAPIVSRQIGGLTLVDLHV